MKSHLHGRTEEILNCNCKDMVMASVLSVHVARITMDEVLPLARPNFALVADGLALAAEHVRRCINLPKGDLR
ncbi:hypothetical protein E4U50_004144 [Claviceps purpurea]|nr:hypothetical protein E4U50_004144 [Claviceps purpurea]